MSNTFLSRNWWGHLPRQKTLDKEHVWGELEFFFGHLKFKMTIQYPSKMVKWAAGKANLECRERVRTRERNVRVIRT